MVATLEMTDGTDTWDFTGAVYPARISSLQGFGGGGNFGEIQGQTFRAASKRRSIKSFSLSIIGTTEADLRTEMNELQEMLTKAERWYNDPAITTKVELVVQIGTTDGNNVRFTVIKGNLIFPPDILDTIKLNQFRVDNARLVLETELWGVEEASAAGSAIELVNEVDGANNFYTGSPTDLPHPDLLNLKIIDGNNGTAWLGSKRMWVFTQEGSPVRFYQNADSATEVADPSDGANGGTIFASDMADTGIGADSADTSASVKWTGANTNTHDQDSGGWKLNAFFTKTIAAASLPRGRYRVLPRLAYDRSDSGGTRPAIVTTTNSEIAFAVGFNYGGITKVPTVGGSTVGATGDAVPFSAGLAKLTFEVVDAGEINIPPSPVPDNFTGAALDIRIYVALFLDGGVWNVSPTNEDLTVFLDSIMLMPIDGNWAEIDEVSASDRILIDSISKEPGVYIMNSSDEIQMLAKFNGNLPWLLPNSAYEVGAYRDDAGDPTNIIMDVTPTQLQRSKGVTY